MGSYCFNWLQQGKELKVSMKNSIKIQRTEPFRKAIGSVSLLKTSQFLFVASFSVSRNSSKINYAFELILYFFKIFINTIYSFILFILQSKNRCLKRYMDTVRNQRILQQ